MINFIKSAFFINFIVVLIFTTLAFYTGSKGYMEASAFCGIFALVFSILLPACSTKS